MAIGSTALIVSRLPLLQAERRIESPLSRESIFLVNNLLLVGLAVVVFYGTFFPLIAEAVTGERSSLGSPWFDRYVTPIGVAARALHRGRAALRLGADQRRRAAPRARGARGGGGRHDRRAGAHHRRRRQPWALFLFGFAAFTGVALTQEFWRAAASRSSLTGEALPVALPRAIARNRRRYGGYIAHAGIVVLLVAIAASSSFQTNRDLRLDVGESATVGDYEVTYVGLSADPQNERIAFNAVLDVQKDGEQFAALTPARNYYPTQDPAAGPIGRYFEGEATSEVGLKSGAGEDFWAAFSPTSSRSRTTSIAATRQLADIPPAGPGTRDRRAGGGVRRGPAARDLPGDRQPARLLALDRRADRARRRRLRDLALLRGPPPRPGRLRGPARPRPEGA